jgi:hypothetical protein
MVEELMSRISASTLNDEDKERLHILIKPKVPYHRREEIKEQKRIKYNTDEEYRQKTLKKILDYYYRVTADKEKQKRGRKQIYESEEEKRRITNERMKEKYHEKTKDLPKQPRGRKPQTLEEKINKMTEKFNHDLIN